MLLVRILSSIIGGPILLYLVYRGGIFVLFLTTLLTLVAIHEIFNMAHGLGVRAWRITGLVAGLLFCFGAGFEQGRLLPLLAVLWLIYCLARFAWNYPHETISDLGFNYLAVSYVGLLFVHLVALRQLDQGIYLSFLAFGLTWAADTGAFFVGKALGKSKLAPLISPNKTIEGAVGGLIAATLIALVVGYFYPNSNISFRGMALLGVAVGITGQVGDLVESALKRMAGVKDSGKLIPGHGGVLDRFDSILFTVPTVYYLFLGLIIS